MSWDASFSVSDADGHWVQLYATNYTHNCNQMLREAGFDSWWDGLEGMSGLVAAEAFDRVLLQWDAEPDHFEEMNPENGWGGLASLTEVITEMRDFSAKFPSGRWSIDG